MDFENKKAPLKGAFDNIACWPGDYVLINYLDMLADNLDMLSVRPAAAIDKDNLVVATS